MYVSYCTNETEFEFRLEQACELAARIHRVPLTQLEIDIVYRHWISITSYCLPITTFDIKQANTLTSPVYQAMLLPMGTIDTCPM